jgi:hypothetical protein
MRKLMMLSAATFLWGCAATTLTADGSGVVTLSQADSAAMLGDCDRLGSFVANSASSFGGAIGDPQALADAKNKTAAMGGDTAVINDYWENFSGSHLGVVAYRCHGASPKKIEIVETDKPGAEQAASQTNKYEDLRKLEELRTTGVVSQEEFEAEKKKILAR